MNALLLDRRIVMPQPGRLLLLPVALWVAIPMAVLVIALTKAPNLHLSLLTTLIMVAELSAAVTIAHKQILATSPSFFHGGLRRALLRAQFAWALGEAAAVAALVALAPPGAGPAIVVTAFGAALVVHALTALVMLRLTHAYMLPFFILYALFQLPSVMQAGREGKLDAVLGASGWWLAGATLLLWLLARMLLRPDLHRRLCGTMVLGGVDFLRPGRVQEFKRQGERNRRPGDGPRWRQQLIAGLVGRAGAARADGRPVAARVWQLLALDAAVSFSTRRRVLAVIALLEIAAMVFFGYYDGAPRDVRLTHWFSGLLYQAALFPFYGLSSVLLSGPAVAFSRRDAFRAELSAVGALGLVSLATGSLISGAFMTLAAVMPPVTWNGCLYVFTAPPLQYLWLGPLMGPVAWLAVALWPRPVCTVVNTTLGPMFIVILLLLTLMPHRTSLPISAGISIAALGIAFVMRRRWWERADLAL